ncbi:unnamed protein product [Lymnaea stagnalis]|uniref:RING-type E3 ubiquitin transferase n=1 Tax=Lymnaea stagnalis TaxID=6523 RepID=A0AAV2H112_LYMST
MSEKMFKVCKLTLADEVFDVNKTLLKEITNLGFKIVRIDPLYITGDDISHSAYTKLGEVLSHHLVSKPSDIFSDTNEYESQNDHSHARRPSPTKHEDSLTNLNDSFDILSSEGDTSNYEDDLISHLSQLHVKSTEDDENDSKLLNKGEKLEKLASSPNPVIDTHLFQQAKNKEQLSISKICSEDMHSLVTASGHENVSLEEERLQIKVDNDRSDLIVSDGRDESVIGQIKTMANLSLVTKSERNEPGRKLNRSISDNSYAQHDVDEKNKDSSHYCLSCQRIESIGGKAIINPVVSERKEVSRDTRNTKDKIERPRGEMIAVEGDASETTLRPSKRQDKYEKKDNHRDSHVAILEKSPVAKNGVNKVDKTKLDIKAKQGDIVNVTDLTGTTEEKSQNFKKPLKSHTGEKREAEVTINSSEDDCENKTSVKCSSKLSHPTHVSNKTQPETEVEDVMESTATSSEDVAPVVFRFKKKEYLAANKYFKDFNLPEYSVEKGNEFEITLNKKSDHLLISKIKEFKVEEIPINNHEKAKSAMKNVSEKYMNVKISIKEKSVLIYGLKKDVLPAKKNFITELGNEDDIYVWAVGDSASSGDGVVARDQNGQKNELKRHETENYMNRDKVTNWEQEKCNAAIDCTFDRKEETFKKCEAGAQQFFEGGGRGRHLDGRGQLFYAGSKSDLKVYVRKENITKLDVDIIVNAANRHLRHGGGVASAIALAAGYSLKNECNSHINTNGPLEVTDVFVSSGGLLKAKYVMHAVGPKWVDYPDKHRCLTELRRTVIRCLVEASRRRKVSIALPSISAAIFKVPQALCARCYMEAVKHFDDFAEKLGVVPVKTILFVDIDDDMVNIIQEEFINEWPKPVDRKIAEEDYEFAQQHLSKKGDDKLGSSAIKNKDQRPSSQGMKLLDESTVKVTQAAVSNTIAYQVNSIQISIVSKPATVYRSAIVVVGKLFDELTGLKKFNVKDSAKPIHDLPKQKGEFQYLSLSKPDGSRSTLICQLHPNPDSPDNVTKAFGNLENVKEIHKSDTVVFTSAIFYAKPKKIQDHSKIVSRIAQMIFDFAAGTSRNSSAIKSILISTSADCIPHFIKIFESRKVEKILPGKAIRAGNQGTGGYQATSSGYPAASVGYPAISGGYPVTSGGYPVSSGGYPVTSGGYSTTSRVYPGKASGSPDYSSGYKAIPGVKQDLGSSVDSQDSCSVCFESINIQSLLCCQALICSTCLGRVSICPFCRFHFKILIGKQPRNGDMGCFYFPSIDVHGYERKGSLMINYYIPSGKQAEELQHPSPGKSYNSVKRTAYLPATDDGFRALRLLRVAFHRRLIFTIDVSHTTQNEGIVWNIHHKTSPHSSEHGYPDPNYLMSLMFELSQNGVTEDSMTHEEMRLVDDLMACLMKDNGTRV